MNNDMRARLIKPTSCNLSEYCNSHQAGDDRVIASYYFTYHLLQQACTLLRMDVQFKSPLSRNQTLRQVSQPEYATVISAYCRRGSVRQWGHLTNHDRLNVLPIQGGNEREGTGVHGSKISPMLQKTGKSITGSDVVLKIGCATTYNVIAHIITLLTDIPQAAVIFNDVV